MNRHRSQVQDFTVGWISALPLELEAATAMLDEKYDSSDDTVQYVLGRIGRHNIVMGCLPKSQIGTNAAAAVATRMQSKFPSMQIGLMVGIGGGVPSSTADVRLGDVIIGTPQGNFGGVVQYDFGKTGRGGSQTRTGFSSAPPPSLLTAVSRLQADPNASSRIEALLQSNNVDQKFKRCNAGPDNLYRATYNHVEGATCDGCSKDMLVTRAPRENNRVIVQYGTIASGNQVMKDGITRDRLSAELEGVLCFEMEAAGLVNVLPCLIIRGICDYADSHKNKRWQSFAAMAAAAYAKEVLAFTPAIRRQSIQLALDGRSSVFSVPFAKDKHFVDRPGITDRLWDIFGPGDSAWAALIGIGGVGKSQIAIEYAYRLRSGSPLIHIFWVHASNPERFRQSYRNMAGLLQLPGFDDPKTDVLNLVYVWLCRESNGPWLMILDNMDDDRFVDARQDASESQHEFTVRKYLPLREGGSILITSRDRNAAFRLIDDAHHLLEVRAMSAEEAREILDNKLDSRLGSKEERSTLATELEHIPLALTQAAAYINRKSRMTIARYLDILSKDRKGGASLLQTEESDLRRSEGMPNSVIRTWQITFDQIRAHHESAADLLARMALFDRTGIPELLLQAAVGEGKFDEAIDTLIGFALVSTEIGKADFEMHRLIQVSTIVWLRHVGDFEQQKEAAISALAKCFPVGSFENWATCLCLEPHALSVLKHGFLSDASRRSRARVQRNRAWYYIEQGKYSMAEQAAEQSVDDARCVLGDEHPDTLSSTANLASTYWNQGRWKEAEKLEVRVMETSLRVLGEEHPSTLSSTANLASTYWNQGRWKEAEKLEVRVMETSLRVLGEEHPSTLTSMNNLAFTYEAMGRKDKAVQLMETTARLRKKILGPDHPYTKSSASALASWMRR